MIIIANVLSGIGLVLGAILNFIFWLVIIRALLSWVNPDPFNPIVRFIVSATDPFLRPLKKLIPPIGGSIDLTPIVLILLILFLQVALVRTIDDYALQLRQAALTN